MPEEVGRLGLETPGKNLKPLKGKIAEIEEAEERRRRFETEQGYFKGPFKSITKIEPKRTVSTPRTPKQG